MTVVAKAIAGASFGEELKWDAIDWHDVQSQVRQIQLRIAKAIREKKFGKAKALQHLLSRSFHAKLLAVKRVTDNKGSKTAGVDHVKWTTDLQKMNAVLDLNKRGYTTKPLKRIYIPKRNGQLRPLSIPTMKCRAMQALYLLGLEPVAETLADPNSYGFRPKRSAADAIEQCFNVLAKKNRATWILEGDIKACFDNINHDWLLANIPMDKTILRKWLRAGYIEDGTVSKTEEGTPQGGIISPCLLTMTLMGLEDRLKKMWSSKNPFKVNIVIYADDFIVTGLTKEVLENEVQPTVTAFLKERGLQLSPEKTKISRIDCGFNFLGFNIRKYNGKLLIKPGSREFKNFVAKLRLIIKTNQSVKTEELIRQLNPKIRGWANYYRHVVSAKTFSQLDHYVFQALWRWSKRRHPQKRATWVKKKYFCTVGRDNWVFASNAKDPDGNRLSLVKAKSVSIRRHIKIKSDANPYDPNFEEYLANRRMTRKSGST